MNFHLELDSLRQTKFYQEIPKSQRPVSPKRKEFNSEQTYLKELEIYKQRLIRIHERLKISGTSNEAARMDALKATRNSKAYKKMVKFSNIVKFVHLPDPLEEINDEEWFCKLDRSVLSIERNIEKLNRRDESARKTALREARSCPYYRKMVEFPHKFKLLR